MSKFINGIDLDGQPLINVPNPVNGTDAMNKQSAEALISQPFIYLQSSPASTWNINHNLGKLYPNIVIVDSANDLIIGYQINPIDINNIQLIFSAAFSGSATLT